MNQRIWRVYLALCVAAVLAYFTAMPPALQSAAYDVFGLSAVVAVLVGVRLWRPVSPGAWYLMAVGQLLFVVGDVLSSVYETVLEVDTFPSYADLVYLAGYPVFAAGLVRLIQLRSPGRDTAGLIDAATIATSAGVASWVFLITPYASDLELPLIDRLVSVAYPAADLLLLALTVRLIVGGGVRPLPFYLLVASFAGLLAADTAHTGLVLLDIYHTGHVVDAGWLLGYALFGAAALHPKMIELSRHVRTEHVRPTARRFLLLGAATLVAPAILAIQAWRGAPLEVPVIVIGSVVLFGLVLARAATLAFESADLGDRVRHLAFHDSLTGLPNRNLLRDRMALALAASARDPRQVVAVLIDLDDFKSVNDTLGHGAGDKLLAGVATRLERCIRVGETLARLGGDEFSVLMPSAGPREARALAERLLHALAEPLVLEGREFSTHGSIGIALATLAHDVDTLLRDADLAMYAAKTAGKRRFVFFDPEMHSALVEQMDVDAALQHAVLRNELVVHYQPIFDIASERAVGAEALVRWARPGRGLLAPSVFLPRAEDLGLLPEIGQYVLEQACATLAELQRTHGGPLNMSVNLSPDEVHDDTLVEQVRSALARHGLEPRTLVLEISERTALHEPKITAARLRELRALGVRVALDDFGTHATLGLLRSLPVDILKLDRSVVSDLPGQEAREFVGAIVAMATALKLEIVAEGVETREQLAALREMGCHQVQGFLLARPLVPGALTALLGGQSAPAAEVPARA